MAKSIHVFFTDRDEFFENNEETVFMLAEMLTEYIIKNYQEVFLRTILETQYDFAGKDEQMFIMGNIYDELKPEELHDAVYAPLLAYLMENRELNINGFVRFRLQAYMEMLEDTVERAVNMYIVEIEYNQLIEYLTMYVELQPPLVHKILITVQKNRYVVMDEQYQEILSLTDFEDTMLDILITLSPEIIYIYNVQEFENRQLLKTISKVFKNRVCAFETEIPMPAVTGPHPAGCETPFQFTF